MAESKEIQAARIIQNSLLSNKPKRKPDFQPIDLNEVIPGFSDHVNADPMNGWHCCLFCHKEFKRMEMPDPFKRPDVVFRPLPVCKCIGEAEDRKEAEKARQERKRRLQSTYAKSIMAAALVNASLSNFEAREGTEKAKAKADEFVSTWETRPPGLGLFLFGPVGNGKSHLARGIEREIDGAGWATLFIDWPQFSELTKATFSNNSKLSVADYVRAAIDADLLVFDELGAGSLSVWDFSNLLFPIINGRQGKRTIYTSNLNPQRLTQWFARDKDNKPLDEDGRLMDRIIGSCELVKNNGTSKRFEDAEKRAND